MSTTFSLTEQGALRELLYKMADDALIIGHRNSEWTGLGPTIEEDIAFSSMAQDKIGHASALYTILHEQLGEKDPDTIGFTRAADAFKSCWLVELPIGGYEFSLMRHFLFDHAEMLRYTALKNSTCKPLAQLANKIIGEIKYHLMHANIWIKQLANATPDARNKLQMALNEAWPYALGIFEEGKQEQILIESGLFVGEVALREQWMAVVIPFLTEQCHLNIPATLEAVMGGRQGYHSEYLAPLLHEMTAVYRIDETAAW